jgi:hypothetical protein
MHDKDGENMKRFGRGLSWAAKMWQKRGEGESCLKMAEMKGIYKSKPNETTK